MEAARPRPIFGLRTSFDQPRKDMKLTATSMAIGVAIGVAIGLVIDNIIAGIGIGIAIMIAFSLVKERK